LLFRPTVNNPLPLYRMNPRTRALDPQLWLGPGASAPIVSATPPRLVYTRDVRDTNIWRVTLGASPAVLERIAVSSFREVAPQYSPDGKRLAFHSNRGGSVQVWLSDADGSRAVQLTSMDPRATTGSPRWSPDGKSIVFDSNAGGGYHLYIVSADGGQPRALTSGSNRNFTGWFSADGRWIYFSSDRSGPLEVWRLPPSGGTPEQVTHVGSVSAPALSPDGRWLYYVKDEGVNGLWRQPVAGGAAALVVESVVRYNFAPTNAGIYYVARPAQPNGRTVIRYFDLASRQTKDIAPVDARIDLGLGLSPDGRYLLFTKIDYLGADLMLVDNFR
jgi:Tol biopolymer transport system component